MWGNEPAVSTVKQLNIQGNPLGDDLKENIDTGSHLKIAAASFSIYAYEALKEELQKVEKLKFIFTEPTFIDPSGANQGRKERREFYIPKQNRESSLYGSEFEIQLRNKLTQRAIARECANWIRRKAEFRSNKTTKTIQKTTYLTRKAGPLAYLQLEDFTTTGLGYERGDAVSNIVTRLSGTAETQAFLDIFEQAWNDKNQVENVTETVCAHIESVYEENSPERIYFLVLYNIFHQFLEETNEDNLPNERTGYRNSIVWNKLYNFQRDAAVALINKLETYNGAILADSVGLGKTFTALAVIKYYELRNKSVLVLCPKKLGDNWKTYNSPLVTNTLLKDALNYKVFYHTDLSRTSGESNGIPLNQVAWGNFDLVVIDESHNFRNDLAYKDRETRYQKLMNKVIRSGVQTRVLMLSATPVNNRFSDLKNQLALAYEDEPEKLQEAIGLETSVDSVFRNAQRAFNDWSELEIEERTPEALLKTLDFDFFELLDAVTIARSRKHIEAFYDTTDIGSFPIRLKPISHRSPITVRKDVPTLNMLVEYLNLLNLSVYTPMTFVHQSQKAKYEALYDTQLAGGRGGFSQVDREDALKKLMLVNLLKRLESSVHSFRLTLKNLSLNLEAKLTAIEQFEGSGRQTGLNFDLNSGELSEEEQADFEEFSVGNKTKIHLGDMDLISWKRELEHDYGIINDVRIELDKVQPEDDTKLQHLHDVIRTKVETPINPNNRKILIFTAFSDTAEYLFEQLKSLGKELHLSIGMVTGTKHRTTLKKPYDFQSILTLFSPVSKDKDKIFPNNTDELDILIGTDCISEGQNLQDCDYVINYDIHWNPVRIIQRFGRVDRIGSKNEEIQLVNYWPDIDLDEYINLKERVENKMVVTDITASGDENVLTSQAGDVDYRHDQLQRLQQGEILDLEDTRTGVSITDLGLNDFRSDLLELKQKYGELKNVPKGLHAVLQADPDNNLPAGVIYVLKNVHDRVNVNQQNRLHPYYLVYIQNDGEILINHTQVKQILDRIRSNARGRTTPALAACKSFNDLTDDGRNMSAYSELLTRAIQSMVEVRDEKAVDSLFSSRSTTALQHTYKDLKDFELIAFLVVEDGE